MAGRVAAGYLRQEKKGADAVACAPFFFDVFLGSSLPKRSGAQTPSRLRTGGPTMATRAAQSATTESPMERLVA